MTKEDVESPYRLALSDVVRINDECEAAIVSILDGKSIVIEGKECRLTARRGNKEVFLDILDPTDNLSRLEFRILSSGRFDYE